jgi:hypothetical protein
MSTAPNEAARQRALDTYRVVDSLPEAAYDDIVQLAASICGVPVATVSLIDRDRQWFKAEVGLGLTETSRDVAFCDHAIRSPGLLMEVPDARIDPRFVNNPLVTGDTAIRFYAGMPLVTPGGAAIGTVCVIDQQPRQLDPRQRSALAALARLTMNLLEGRHRERELERAALLATVTAAESSAPAPAVAASGYTLAIFELQDYAALVRDRGERTVERLLSRIEKALDTHLRHARGDSVSRVSASAELIVVLHGDDTAPALAAMRAELPAIEREAQLRLISSEAEASPAGEPVAQVFLRADEALSKLKDELAGRADVA